MPFLVCLFQGILSSLKIFLFCFCLLLRCMACWHACVIHIECVSHEWQVRLCILFVAS